MSSLILCCGAGGTGKSTWASSLEGYYHYQSPTRQVYRSLGLTHQRDFEALNSDQRRFLQAKIFITYATGLLRAVEEHPKVVADRSPFCHVGYATRYDPSSLSFYEWPVRSLLRQLPEDLSVRFFPWPPPFEVPDDGFRHQNLQEETAFDSHLRWVLQHFQVPYTEVGR